MILDSAVKDVNPFHHAGGSDVQVLENQQVPIVRTDQAILK